MRRIRAGVFLVLSVAVAAACGSSSGSGFGGTSGGGNGTDASYSAPNPGFVAGDGGDNGTDGSPNNVGQPIVVSPADPTITYKAGDPLPTSTFVAKIVATGEVVPASWAIDRGEIGSVGLTSGVFTASGTTGGKATITATYQGTQASTSVTVILSMTENGNPNGSGILDAGTGGAGGNGGVGGNPAGGSIDQDTIAALHGAPQTDTGLSMLYPYDQTVWPRGILPPLLMWQPGAQTTYDAVSIKLTETNFTYEGFFAANGLPFQNTPLSKTAWTALTTSNGGEPVTVTLTFVKNKVAYGPITTTWKIASAPLKGVVYYNSYGTNLVSNYPGAIQPGGGTHNFGAATLAVHGDSLAPVPVAGTDGVDGTTGTNCRVCHSVAANGSTLITQRKQATDRQFSQYDLKQTYPAGETQMTPTGADGNGIDQAPWAWSAIYPDGSMFLNDSSGAAGSTGSGNGQPGNALYASVSGAGPATPSLITSTGWPAGLRAAFPAFSPDGKGIAFTAYTGASIVDPAGSDQRTLGYMPFDKTTNTFGQVKLLYTPDQSYQALYPAFLPTNDALIFEKQIVSNGRDYGGTRAGGDSGDAANHGAQGELWWVQTNVNGTPIATRLNALNGYKADGTTSYLPHGANGHDPGVEESLNYEPTVNPVPSGGYAWVVFTSRRMYGNVATMNPWWSDPRYHDLTTDPTPKKLWVAAIDLESGAVDPSHPAFYLPAQELLAGNARGYWVVDPCKADGNGCASGDECCGGYCRPAGDGGALVCSNVVPQCAQEFEKCSTSADCCNNPDYQCINARCALPGVK